MGLKILHSADWHLDSPFAAFREDRRAFLKQAQLQIPGKISLICRQNHCDLMLLAGDIFDGAWSRDTLQLLKDALEEAKVPVMISPGNHDPWGPGSPWMESFSSNVHVFQPEISSVVLKDLDCRVYGAGFARMDCRSLLKGFHAEGNEQWQIGVFHGDPTNVGSPYNPVTSAQIRESGLHYLALGHVHSAGGLEVENTVCGWPGCPMGRGWDETGLKGCLIADLQDQVRMQTVDLGLPGFFQETLTLNSQGEADFDLVLPPVGNRNFYRITLEGYGKVELSKLYDRFSDFPNLELRDETVDPDRLWSRVGEDSLPGAYFGKLKASADQAEPELQQKILLAAEISQKLLEGREVQLP